MSCFIVRKTDNPSISEFSIEKGERVYRKGDIVCVYQDKKCEALGKTERMQSKNHIAVKVSDLSVDDAKKYERPFKREYSIEKISSGFGQCSYDVTIDLSESKEEVFSVGDVNWLAGIKTYNTYEIKAENKVRLYFKTEDTDKVEGNLQYLDTTIRNRRWALPDEIVDSANEYGIVTMTKAQFLNSIIDKRTTENAHKAVIANGSN